LSNAPVQVIITVERSRAIAACMTITPLEAGPGSHSSHGGWHLHRSHAGIGLLRTAFSRGEFEKGYARMPPAAIVDPTAIDTSRILADREAIRGCNPQRFEMEQLTAITHLDLENKLVIGYKDVKHDEFWVRGHMPDFPLMPGVLICEAAAQLSSYYCHQVQLHNAGFIAFGGMEDVRFRGKVRPGDRLVLVAKAVRLHRRHTMFESQGFVGTNMVFHARIIGVPMTGQDELVPPS
jgi:3-hydroxyacyl-[acyl-carrier-protein] dehydratase